MIEDVAQLIAAGGEDLVDHDDAVLRGGKAEEEGLAKGFARGLAFEALKAKGHEGPEVHEGFALVSLPAGNQLGSERVDRLVALEVHRVKIGRYGTDLVGVIAHAPEEVSAHRPAQAVLLEKGVQERAGLGALQRARTQFEKVKDEWRGLQLAQLVQQLGRGIGIGYLRWRFLWVRSLVCLWFRFRRRIAGLRGRLCWHGWLFWRSTGSPFLLLAWLQQFCVGWLGSRH